MCLKPDSHSVSVEDLKVAPTALLLALPTQPSHTQKINRKSNARAAKFHLYQNVPVDQHNRPMSLLLNNIEPGIFIYFLSLIKITVRGCFRPRCRTGDCAKAVVFWISNRSQTGGGGVLVKSYFMCYNSECKNFLNRKFKAHNNIFHLV